MVSLRNVFFVASVWIAFASLVDGRFLNTTERVTLLPFPNPSAADIAFATYGNANPAGSFPIPGLPVRILQRSDVTGFRYTEWGCAQLNQATVNTGTGTTNEIRERVLEIGVPGDHAGHIFAQSLGPFPGHQWWNIMPMSASTNQGSYSSIESQIRTDLAVHGSIQMYVRGDYAPGRTRPFRIFVYAHTLNNQYQKLWITSN